jgi:hypothetical protein
MATGRDAADVAFLTSFGTATMTKFEVTADRAVAPHHLTSGRGPRSRQQRLLDCDHRGPSSGVPHLTSEMWELRVGGPLGDAGISPTP